jgi:vitamin B12 transporter
LNKQKDLGFELSQRFQPDSKTTLKVYYTYVTGKVFTVNDQRDTNYFNLLRTPKHTIGFNINRQLNRQLYISVNIKSFGARNDLFFDLNTYETNSVKLKPYTLIDLYADYSFRSSKFKLFIDAKNLLNQSYTDIYGYNTMKFNFNLGLCLNY